LEDKLAVLKNLDIKLISLVRAGANKKKIIYKESEFNEVLRVEFKKNEDEIGVVYGIVYAPNDVDTQGDVANADEIRKAAYNFMKKSNVYAIDVEHEMKPVDAYICESWIVKDGDAFFGDYIGAWAVGIKIEDDLLKKDIKNGVLTGLSMYGSGVVEDDFKVTKKGIVELIKEAISSIFENKQQKGEGMNEDALKTIIKSIADEAIAKFESMQKELKEKIEVVEKEVLKSKQLTETKEIGKSATGGIL